MTYRIETVNASGIRGLNKPEKMTFSKDITLLFGENGSGKSSLLQSIEWAITGNLSYMRGGDFSREDAIVNLFNKSKKAIVEITLRSNGSTKNLKRTRKMGSRTASGKQPLELDSANKILKDEEAEAELEKVLNISLGDFHQCKYLHQETIREILYAKPEERSLAIDKLLGTYEIREFIKTLDIDRRIKASTETMQETIDALNRDKIQFHLNLKRSVDKIKASLMNKGYAEKDLTPSAVYEKLRRSSTEVESLKKKYGAILKASPIINPDAHSLGEAHKTLLSQLNDLDRSRLGTINEINSQKTDLRSNAKRYDEVHGQLQGMKQTDPQALTARIKKIGEELNKISSLMKDLRQKLASLPHKRSIYETNKKRLEAEIRKLDTIRKEYGTVEIIQSKIEKLEEQLKSIQCDAEKLSGQQRLISLATDYLENTRTNECPVCLTKIDNKRLIGDLKTKVSDQIAKSIGKLEADEKEIKSQIRVLNGTRGESNMLSETVGELEASLATSEEDIRKLVPSFDNISLDDVVREWEKEIEDLSGKESEIRGEEVRLRDTLKRFSQLTAEMGQLQTELRKATESKDEGSELLKAVQKTLESLDSEIQRYSDSSAVDTLRNTLADLDDVLNYLRDEEQVQAAEKELPLVERQITDLETRATKLQTLANSLQSIRQLASTYEKEASIAQLKRLEDNISHFYSRIQGHPHFTRLKIDIEKEDPLIFSIRAASAEEDTYIPTRFSIAQLNTVALSIFMAYSTQQAGNLPIMIFDDPTQNMDNPHKESFAKLVATLPPKHQVIIATEDADTRKFLEKHCKEIKTYELGNWTTEGTETKAVGVG